MTMGRDFIVVPEALEADRDGRPTRRPSFAFRQVLDEVARLAGAGDRVFLAPANSLGGPVTEEQAAWDYLRRDGAPAFALFCPGENLGEYRHDGAYVDTWDNAVRLARVLDRSRGSYELVAGRLHAPRAAWCFARCGYRIARVHAVAYRQQPGRMMPRHFYYRFPLLHRAYEALAFLRDRWRHG